jgi:hypothetical protein
MGYTAKLDLSPFPLTGGTFAANDHGKPVAFGRNLSPSGKYRGFSPAHLSPSKKSRDFGSRDG